MVSTKHTKTTLRSKACKHMDSPGLRAHEKYHSATHLLKAFNQSLDLLSLLSLRWSSPWGRQGLCDVSQRFVDLRQSHGSGLRLWRSGRVAGGDGAQLLFMYILLQLLFQGADVLLFLQLGSHLLHRKNRGLITLCIHTNLKPNNTQARSVALHRKIVVGKRKHQQFRIHSRNGDTWKLGALTVTVTLKIAILLHHTLAHNGTSPDPSLVTTGLL